MRINPKPSNGSFGKPSVNSAVQKATRPVILITSSDPPLPSDFTIIVLTAIGTIIIAPMYMAILSFGIC